MISASLLLVAAAVFCIGLSIAVLFGTRGSVPRWSFCAGMLIFAAESVCGALALHAATPEAVRLWHAVILALRTFIPAVWLVFSLTYSRGQYPEYLAQSRVLLIAACFLPLLGALLFQPGTLTVSVDAAADAGFSLRLATTAQLVIGLVLVGSVVVVTNLERTFRAAVGTMRWRIKFLVLGLGMIFAARIYTASQTLLFSRHDSGLAAVDASALLVGCVLITIAYLRSGWSDVEVYPSRTVLQSSVTVIVAGAYLFVVGVLAQIVSRFGEARYFQAQALIILLGVSGLAILLLSDRLRERLQRFVSRHFKRPQHDSQKVWSLVTERLARLSDEKALAATGAKLISETFHVLAVTVWVWEEHQQRLIVAASTAHAASEENVLAQPRDGTLEIKDIGERIAPFDLETITDSWGETLRQANPTTFEHSGPRLGVPLVAGSQWLGLAVLADRVSGVPYTLEEMELLKCMGDQLAASLLNLRLTGQIVRSRELEAFQTVSAFFVHDLKNAASSLNLTLRNLPIHFDDPAFRADALRAISGTMERINSVTSRLSLLRGRLDLRLAELDLNDVVTEIVKGLNATAGFKIETSLSPVPKISADRERIHSVITNLLLNARDAIGTAAGIITVRTSAAQNSAVVSVSDTGCGMTAEFLRHSLFRPFQTTKKEGIGIGMFQVKTIVEAHGGTIQVESEQGKGSTFHVVFPSIATTA
jgi:putative PEP-CTERM system histidine kinase